MTEPKAKRAPYKSYRPTATAMLCMISLVMVVTMPLTKATAQAPRAQSFDFTSNPRLKDYRRADQLTIVVNGAHLISISLFALLIVSQPLESGGGRTLLQSPRRYASPADSLRRRVIL